MFGGEVPGPFQKPRRGVGEGGFQLRDDHLFQRRELQPQIARGRVGGADQRRLRIAWPAENVIGAGKPLPALRVGRVLGKPCRQPVDHAFDHRLTLFVRHLGGGGDVGLVRPSRRVSCRRRVVNRDSAGPRGVGDVLGKKGHPGGVGGGARLKSPPDRHGGGIILVLIGGEAGQEQRPRLGRIDRQDFGNKPACRHRDLAVGGTRHRFGAHRADRRVAIGQRLGLLQRRHFGFPVAARGRGHGKAQPCPDIRRRPCGGGTGLGQRVVAGSGDGLGLFQGGGDFGAAFGQRLRRQVGAPEQEIEPEAGRHDEAAERQAGPPVDGRCGGFGRRGLGGRVLSRLVPASPTGKHDGAAAKQDHDRRPPQDVGRRRHGRVQKHVIAIGLAKRGKDFVVRRAGGQLLADLDPQVARQLGVGIIDRLVLADKAAKLFRQRAGACFQRRVGQHLLRRDGRRLQRQQRQRKQQGGKPGGVTAGRSGHCRSLIAGRSTSSRTRLSIGPAWRRTIVPPASTRKVSGTP